MKKLFGVFCFGQLFEDRLFVNGYFFIFTDLYNGRMTNRAKKTVLYIFDKIKDPVLLVCVVISSALWLINKLNEVYVDTVTIPVVVTGALANVEQDRIANDDKIYFIECKFEAKGFVLFAINRTKRVVVSPEEVVIFRANNEQQFEIDVYSLKKALESKFPNANLLEVINKRVLLQTLSFTQKKVPLVSGISIALKGEYMQIGKTYLEPDSVTVYGSVAAIDTVTEIRTSPLFISNPMESNGGYVQIPSVDNIEITPRVCSYTILIERYTEMKYSVDISLPAEFSDRHYAIYPPKVDIVFNVAQNIYSQFNPQDVAFFVNPKSLDLRKESVDYVGNNQFLIEHSTLPVGVDIRSITPMVVTLLKTQ